MKIVFMGTPDFASYSLQSLVNEKFNVVGVFTNQDTKKGRGMKVSCSPVKEIALQNNIPVFQPDTLKSDEVFEQIKELSPDIIIVVAYGKILPENILNYPKFGCINVHGSLLPKYRGAAPIQWAILNGEKTTGITTMYMSKGLDEGDMLLKDEIDILEYETSGELFERLKMLGAKTLIKTLNSIENNEVLRIKQDENLATYAPMLKKEYGNLDFTKNADEILRKIYGLNPWPSAYTTLNNLKVKIFKAHKINAKDYECGTIFDINDGLCVVCGENSAICITEIQVEGKKRMTVLDYLKGNKIDVLTKFERN